MSFLRALTLICFGFGLFVQVSAQTAALPQVEAGEMTDCMKMAATEPMQMGADREPTDKTGSCQNMTLDCLTVMNCVPPLSLADAGQCDVPSPPIDMAYSSALAPEFDSRPTVPESPPPQIGLTV